METPCAIRWSPSRVEALAHGVVGAFGAGDAHSLAVLLPGARPDPLPRAPPKQQRWQAKATAQQASAATSAGVKSGGSGGDVGASGLTLPQAPRGASGSGGAGTKPPPPPRPKPTLHELACEAFPTPGCYAWGRGAHGRLGNGRNLNRRAPTLITNWPDSFEVPSTPVNLPLPASRFSTLN